MLDRLRGASPAHLWAWTLLVALASAAISVGRLWLANPDSLTTVLWAEDGLFPLCVAKVGWLSCLFDPFAGYSIFVPRVLAGVTALFPVSAWPVVVLILGALLAALTGGWAFWWLRRYGLGVFVSAAVALLPVLTPIVGMESLNVIASVYMPMLFLGVLFLALPLDRMPVWPLVVFFALTALTIPLAAIFLALLVFQMAVRQVRWSHAAAFAGATAVGLVGQWLVAQSATKPREITPSLETLDAWAHSVPTAVLTFWPGLSLGEVSVFTNYVSRPSEWTGWLAVGALLVVGVLALLTRDARVRGVGLLVLSGLALGAFPSVIGWANNRYFVVPCLLWAAALLVALDPAIRRTRWWWLALLVAFVAVIWWPAMPASAWRTTPAPSWPDEVARVVAACTADPGKVERPIFTPFWPPNWGDELAEPSHPNVSCLIARKWQ